MTFAERRPIESPSAWQPRDIADANEWTIDFSEAEQTEIVAAARHAQSLGVTITTIDQAAFPLPTISERVVQWSHLLNEGRGFLLLRNFPIDELDEAATELAYIGFGTHLGVPVGQDKDATLLGHVRDEGVERNDPSVRIYRTHGRQDFHTDGADLVGLLCLRGALAGGESRIASSAGIYNEILSRRPDLLDVLYAPFAWDRNNEQSPGDDPFFSLPILSDIDGKPRVFYIGWYIRDAQRHPDAPRLTASQTEAMELIESVANDPAFHIEMEFQPGDIQLLNNATILHAREQYTDHSDPAEQRHLLRLWLAAHHFSSVEGILQSGIPQQRSV